MAVLWDTVWSSSFGDNAGTTGEWLIADSMLEPSNIGGFQNLDDVGTAIILALFTNARLPDYMVGQWGLTKEDQREWHGNTFGIEDGEEELGSLLWVCERLALTADTARLAEYYASSALQTLVRQKLVAAFDVTSEVDKVAGRIILKVVAYGASTRTFFADLWPLR